LHDRFQRESHTPYGPPTSVTRLQLLRQQTNTRTSPSLTTETHWQHKYTDCTNTLTTETHWLHKYTDCTNTLTTETHWLHKHTDCTNTRLRALSWLARFSKGWYVWLKLNTLCN
jgi:hypothetical protein